MDMNKFWKVTKFTVVQQVKGQAFKISTTIILAAVLILTALVNIIPAMKSDNSDETSNGVQTSESISIENVYVKDESDLEINLDEGIKQVYPSINIIKESMSKEELEGKIESSQGKDVLLYIGQNDTSYSLRIVTPKDCDEELNDAAHELCNVATSSLETMRYMKNGVPADKLDKVMLPISSEVLEAGEKEKSIEDMIIGMIFPMVACMILFYIIYFYGYWVANSIVAEKTSRVMELLLTSTKPIELVTGKCVGMGSLAIVQFVTIILMAFVGFKGGGLIATNLINSSANVFDIGVIFNSLSISKLLLVILFFILGYVLYAIFNALVGATVSKLEDLNTAIMPVSFLSIIGFYLAYMGLMAEGSTVAKLATFIPFSAPFYIPATILSDAVSMSEMCISLAILIITIIVFVMFTARVYSVVILHTGNRLKFKDLFKIYKTEK